MEGIGEVVLSTGSIVHNILGGPGTSDRVARTQGRQEGWMELEKQEDCDHTGNHKKKN